MPGRNRVPALIPICALAIVAGCGGSSSSGGSTPFLPPPPAEKGKYFTHIVVVIQENRTFDNLFATYPGADGTRVGKTHNGTRRLSEGSLNSPIDLKNAYAYWKRDCNAGPSEHCRMNGFDTVPNGGAPGTYVYQYVNPSQIAPYWDMAHNYVLADHFFQTQGSGSFTAHQDLIRGGTNLSASESLIDLPTGSPWGCDGPPGTVTSLITPGNHYQGEAGPFPCLSYKTLQAPLDSAAISWRYYTPAVGQNTGGDNWNAFDAIRAVRYGADWSVNVVSPETKVFTDIGRDSLPSVAWVIPDLQNSDHPGQGSDTGPSWVAQVVNAIGQSPAWNTTAILILWDDWGGWYDHVPPPGPRRSGGLGFRVPLIVVSPFARRGYISHGQYQFGSVVRFIEDNWNLGRLGTTDETSPSFVDDFFDFNQTPRKYQPVATKYSKEFFLGQRPSNKPVDDD